jgi:hypothetical protein
LDGMTAQSSTQNLVRRRCLACDAERDLLEPPGTDELGVPCTSCGAPTERVAIIREQLVPKNAHAVALGRLGGLKGGPARAAALTSQRRREIARRAVLARWQRKKKP